jgi:nonspecific dipeptidase
VGAFSGAGAKTVIPKKVIGKFSIRIVPSMTVEDTERKVSAYLNKLHAQRGSPNKLVFVYIVHFQVSALCSEWKTCTVAYRG